ncbi:hypothetical protein BH10BAC4_BH10BAC4_00390 [soil metagenome]
MTIREARSSDAKSIQLLLAQLGYPNFDEYGVVGKIKLHDQPGYHILVAEVNEQVVAFVSMHWFDLMHWQGKLGRFTSFCVDENFRSKGVGQKLLKAGEEFLINQGCIKLEVTSNNRREKTHAFYLKAGYSEESRVFRKVL